MIQDHHSIFLSSIAIIIAIGYHLDRNEGNEEASSLRDI